MWHFAKAALLWGAVGAGSLAVAADPLPPDTTYRPLPNLPFSSVKSNDDLQALQELMGQMNGTAPPRVAKAP